MARALPVSVGRGWWRYAISGLGVLLFGTGVGAVVLGDRATGETLLGVAALAVLSLLLVAVGARVAVDIDEPGDGIRVLAWMSGGVIALAALGVWFQIAIPTADTPFETALLFLSALAAGALFGAVVGYYEIRVRGLVERASREAARREFLDEQQEALSALNSILRHQIRNDINAVAGHAALVRNGRVDPEAGTETISDRCEHLVEVLSRIETVVDVLTLVTTAGETAVDETVDRAIATLREDHPEAHISVECDADVTVRADDLLYLAVYEVLDNAVVHGEPPVEVTVDRDGDRVVIAVSDDGPGLGGASPEALLEPNARGSESTGDGLGLFLADLILDRYDGQVRLRSDDPTRVELRLDAHAGEH